MAKPDNAANQPPETKLWKLRIEYLLLVSIVLVGAAVFFRPRGQLIAETLQIFGIALFVVIVGYWLRDKFGADPIIEDLAAQLHELRRVCCDKAYLDECKKIGLTKVYPRRDDARNDVINDVGQSRISCKMYAGVYYSEYIKEGENREFVQALCEAVQKAKGEGRRYLLQYTSLAVATDQENETLLKCWAKREKKSVQEVRQQLGSGSREFARLVSKVSHKVGGGLNAKRTYFKEYLVPHASLIVDERVAYVSLYDWIEPRGTAALTLRFENGDWARQFVDEAQVLDAQHTVEAEAT